MTRPSTPPGRRSGHASGRAPAAGRDPRIMAVLRDAETYYTSHLSEAGRPST